MEQHTQINLVEHATSAFLDDGDGQRIVASKPVQIELEVIGTDGRSERNMLVSNLQEPIRLILPVMEREPPARNVSIAQGTTRAWELQCVFWDGIAQRWSQKGVSGTV